MVGAAADLMSIHLMEGCVAMVTQPGDFVLASGGDVFHHQGQQAYGPTLLQHIHIICYTKKIDLSFTMWSSLGSVLSLVLTPSLNSRFSDSHVEGIRYTVLHAICL